MQQFGHDENYSQSVRITEEEARAMAELHAQRRQLEEKPTIGDLATQLGISETEVLALLTEIRAQQGPPKQTFSHHQTPVQERSISSQMWALFSLGAAVIVVLGGIYSYRAYLAATPPPAEITVTSPFPPPAMAPMPPTVHYEFLEGDPGEPAIALEEVERMAVEAAEAAKAAEAGTPAPR